MIKFHNPKTFKLQPLERAANLKVEANNLLRETRLAELCRPIGELTPTGSYFLDLMIYPDIDLYLPPAKPSQLFHIAAQITETHPVQRVNFQKGGPGSLLENALYIKPVIDVGEWERPWKIDIWAVDQAFIEEKTALLSRYKERLTPKLRELILNYKFSILTVDGRTPMFSGIFIYEAVIDQGMRDFSEITAYLRGNSIDIK
jgi:hypothetical protein